MLRNHMLDGGRESARRLLLPIAAAAMSAVFATTTVSTTESRPADVSVHEQEGIYSVTARFCVPQPPSTALAVLTDYERIPRFMPGVTASVVRERSPERVIVEQEAVARLMMFSKRVYLVLEVTEQSDTLRFRDSAGRSFTIYEGAWRLSRLDGSTAISYELRAKPRFDVPEFLLKRLLTRDARSMIERLRAEFAARQSSIAGTL